MNREGRTRGGTRWKLDLRFKKVITMDSGRHVLFFTVKKETERSGWRITGIGTGL
uniref:DUF4829 domain-containing protein n=1 Tax=Ammonifex degensii TaxID=42838 RepID=A0A7C2E3B3_9THEO